jgi:exosortase
MADPTCLLPILKNRGGTHVAEPSKIDSNLVAIDERPSMPSPQFSQPSDWRDRLSHKLTVLHQWFSEPTNVALLGVAVVLGLAYWPNFRELYSTWKDDPNYSHGSLVIPIALVILWQRLSTPPTKTSPKLAKSSPKLAKSSANVVAAQPIELLQSEPGTEPAKSSPSVIAAHWWGWVGLLAVLAVRAIAYERNTQWTETATLLPAIACITWTYGGWPLLRLVWPAIAFLVFMLPLPPNLNDMIAMPLQTLAATGSCFLLQLSGFWAIQHGNVINLDTPHGTAPLDVALACNGLRMLMTMCATITATVILYPMPNWKRFTLLVSAVPIALVSNMIRIVITGWCYYLFTGSAAKEWAHDISGWMMMPLALALVALELGVLSWLVPDEDIRIEAEERKEGKKPISPLVTRKEFRQGKGKGKSTNQDLDEI